MQGEEMLVCFPLKTFYLGRKAMDLEYLYALQQLRDSLPDAVTSAVTVFSDLIAGPLVYIVVLILFWCVDKRLGYFTAFSYCVCLGVNQLVKNIACVYRPWFLDSRLEVAAPAAAEATGYSFPSGHTTSAVGLFGALAVWFRKHRWVVVLAVVFIALHAFARNFLGCHTPQDVLVAILLASAVLFVVYKVFNYIQEHPEKDILVAGIGLVLCALALAFTACKGYPTDYTATGQLMVDPYDMQTDCFRAFGALMGLLVAWVIERRFINFSNDGTIAQRVIRGVVGAVLVLILYVGILPAALGGLDLHLHKFLEYFLLLIFAAAVYPALIKFAQNRRARS